jgi:DNA-binding NtrC family response regulator
VDARSSVLLLSTDEAIRDTLRWCLAGFVDDVVVSRWGAVIPLVREHGPTVVALDFDAIEFKGRPLLVQLLQTRYCTPMVAVGTTTAILHAESLGIRTCITKPINVGRIISTVANIVGMRRDT